MKKIFIEADSIAYERMSGIGHSTLEIIKALDRLSGTDSSLRVTILVPTGTAAYVKKYDFAHIRIRELPAPQKYINYALTRTSLPLPMDLWFGRGYYLFTNYKTWYVPFSKSIMFVHDIAFKIYPETIQPKNLLYLRANFTRWLRRATVLASISKNTAKEIKHYYPEYADKIKVIPLGVDPRIFFPQSTAAINTALAKYELPADYFMYIGNIEPRKNLGNLLAAYKLYADQVNQPLPLVIIGGGGWNNEAIHERIQSLKQAGYALHTPEKYVDDADLPALYTAARTLVHVAIHEGFGLSPLQAQACGTPVIVSDLPVMKESVDAQHAVFVDPQDIPAIGSALVAAAAQPRQTFKPQTEFTWDRTAKTILTNLDKM